MPVPGVRTLVVSVLAAAVAVRMTATQPLTGAYARIAPDPAGALRSAADGWTVSGTLGDATAQGLRDVPVAAFLWLTDVLGMAPAGGQDRLVRARPGPGRCRRGPPGARPRCRRSTRRTRPWTPWVGAALFACAPVLVTTVQHSPGDGLVVALLPWVLAPLVRGAAAGARRRVRCLARAGRCGHAAVGLRRAGGRPRDGGRDLATPGWHTASSPGGRCWPRSRRLVGGRLRVGGVVRHRRDGSGGHGPVRRRDRRGARAGAGDHPVLPRCSSSARSRWRRPPSRCGVGRDRAVVAALLALSAVATLVGGRRGRVADMAPDPRRRRECHRRGAGAVDGARRLARAGRAAGLDPTRRPPAAPGSPTRGRGASRPARAPSAAGLAVLGVALGRRTRARRAGGRPPAPPPTPTSGPRWRAGRRPLLPVGSSCSRPRRTVAWILRSSTRCEAGRGSPATPCRCRAPGPRRRWTLRWDGSTGVTTGRAPRPHSAIWASPTSSCATTSPPPRTGSGRSGSCDTPCRDWERPAWPPSVRTDRPTTVTAGEPGIVDLGVRDALGSLEVWAVDEAADGTIHDGAPMAVAGGPGVVSDLADAGLAGGSALRARRHAGGVGRRRVRQRTQAGRRPAEWRPTPQVRCWGPRDDRTVVPPDAAAGADRLPERLRCRGRPRVVLVRRPRLVLASHRGSGGRGRRRQRLHCVAVASRLRGRTSGGRSPSTARRDVSTGVLQVVPDPFASYQVTRIRLESDDGATEVDVPATARCPSRVSARPPGCAWSPPA